MLFFNCFKYFDLLSPPITFYYNGYNSHASITSGVLNIISYLIILSCAGYFLSTITKRKNPKVFYSYNYNEDAGTFDINSSSLFHFISIESKSRYSKNLGFDFLKFRILGLDRYFEHYLYSKNISHFDHWLYGKCSKENYTKNISGLNDFDFFGESACISKYFNGTEKKYYSVGESGFKWPKIAHGINNKNNIFYNLIISRCNDDSLKLILGDDYQCDNDTEFENFFDSSNSKLFNFYFRDNYVNILNYNNPFSNFFYKLESNMAFEKIYTSSLHFNPSTVKTNDGLMLDNNNDNISYIFEDSDVISEERKGFDGYIGFRFFLKNTGYYYERNYEKLADLISNLGGIYTAINLIFYFINLHINKYYSLKDMLSILLPPSNDGNSGNNKPKSYNIKINMGNIKRSSSYDINLSKINISDRNKFIKNDSEDNKEKNYSNTEINPPNDNNITQINENDYIDKFSGLNTLECQKGKDNNIENKNKENLSNKNIKEETFWNYTLYKFFGKNKKSFEPYDNFRTRILSEENLVRNYLYIHNLLKVVKNTAYFKEQELYKTKDLLNLI